MKTPSDIRSFVGLATQPSLCLVYGYGHQVMHIARVLIEEGVTERRIINALGQGGVARDILLAIDDIRSTTTTNA